MKKIIGALIALYSAFAFSATLVPIQLLNPTGSTSGQAIVSTGASSAPAWAGVNAVTLNGATFASPPAAGYGSTTPEPVFATTISATSTLTGFPGRLLNVQVFTSSGTYTATTGTNKVIVEVQAPSGGTGGTAATAAGQNAASAGGAGGSYARVLITSGFSGQTVTIGAVGTAGAAGANAGGTGGTTSFGAIISCPGGAGGSGGTAISALGQSGAPAAQTAICTVGSGTVINLTPGQASGSGAVYGIGNLLFGGVGGNSALGIGGQAIGSTVANPGSGYGAGASGIIALASAAAAAGTTGKPAIIIVWEFS